MRKIQDHELADIVRACQAARLEGAPRRAKLAKLKQEAAPGRSRAAWIERRERNRKAEREFRARYENYFFPRRVNDLLRSRA